MFLKQSNEEEGFSLVELLVVIVIIGILAAIAIPLYNNQRTNAYRAVAETDVRNIGMEISSMVYGASDMGTSPASNGSWVSWNSGTGELTLTFNGTPAGVDEVSTVRMTPGSTVSSSGYEGGAVTALGPIWCVAVDHNGQVAVFTEAGLQSNMTTCSASGVAS